MSAQQIEEGAKIAFRKAQENPEYLFEFSELSGCLKCGVVENIYKQAFFSGVKFQKERQKKG